MAQFPASPPTPSPAGFIQPCQPTLVANPAAGPGWLHEMKHDGFRILARKQDERVEVWSRRGALFNDRFPRIAEAVGLPPRGHRPGRVDDSEIRIVGRKTVLERLVIGGGPLRPACPALSLSGATRSMKMGNTRSPWRHDMGAFVTSL